MNTNNRTVWGVSSVCLAQARMRPGTGLVSAIIWMAALACHAVTIPFVGTGSMVTGRSKHTETLLPNGKVLVSGGDSSGGYLSSAELYNPSNGTWTATSAIMTNKCYIKAILLPNGKVLVSGGFNGGSLRSAELYNPSNGTWMATGKMPTNRYAHSVTLLPNDTVLVSGGMGGGYLEYLSSAELYNPSNGTWTATSAMTTNRSYNTATLLPDGKVLVSGGMGVGYLNYLSSAELYNPSNGTWTATGSMAIKRSEHTATLLPDGKVLVSGGDSTGGYRSSAELYNPSNGTWTATGSMTTNRYKHTATLLPNGKVLVSGGYGTGGYLSSAELYNPSNGTWTAMGSMASKRRDHTATLLQDGKVLVSGGYGTGGYLSSAELYGCTAIFDASGGTASSVTKTYYSGSDTYGALPTPVRTGYVFNGWWTGPDGTGTQVTEISALVQGTDHTLYAKWTMALTSQGTPHLWLSQYGLVTGGDYEAAALTDTDSDGHFAWQEYVAGTDPTNSRSLLLTLISGSNGNRRVSWTPDLGTARVYTVNGRTNLTEGVWGTTNSGIRFFRTRVDMP